MSAHRPGWIIRSVVQVLLLGYVLALIWGAIWLQLRQEHIATERDAIKEARNLALAFEENIVRSISAIDQVLLFIRDSYARDPSRFDLNSWTRDRPFINDQTFQLSLIDATGMLVQSNLGQVPVDLSDREHFRHPRQRGAGSAVHQPSGAGPRLRPPLGAVHPSHHGPGRRVPGCGGRVARSALSRALL